MHKRKHRKSIRDGNYSDVLEASLDPCLYVQAHEADVVRGQSLECRDSFRVGNHTTGSGLIRWGPECPNDTVAISPHASDRPPLWVDRYDVRLLLDHLPDFRSESTPPRPASPTGWSDLDSDSEDTFFFSPDELEDYHREKRRRLIDRGREERLRALATIDDQEKDPDPWGASDEEPDEAQRELIRRTAHHIASSPNPGQLEMRILTNYGTDKRFAFLRGRWSRVWRTEKERARRRQTEEESLQLPTALGGLASYGESDTEDGPGDDPSEEPKHVADAPRAREDDNSNEDDIKEARRARAREWSARRRAEQALQPDA